jgi:hypothetical protein
MLLMKLSTSSLLGNGPDWFNINNNLLPPAGKAGWNHQGGVPACGDDKKTDCKPNCKKIK